MENPYVQTFEAARPIEVRVSEPRKIMKYPLEDDQPSQIINVIEPIKSKSALFFAGYRDVFAQMRSMFVQAQLLTVQTRARTYEKMVIPELPHQEATDFIDVLMVILKLEEALFITPEYGDLSQSQVIRSSDASAVNRGTQNPLLTNDATARKTRHS
ncbi:MAG: hypothetical protein JSC189_000407 [Candidatus Tokpelaia sp. JSC189]|nr:MAG: hypothetical protein JSC189_000407 [Candidatus Tokpelaia sp. JSC189]